MTTVRTLVLVVGLAATGVGLWRDVRASEQDRPEGWLWGTVRAQSLRGLRQWLPWYVVGAIGIGLAAFLP